MRNGVGVGRFNGVGVGRNFSFSALQLMQRPTPVRYGVGRRCNAQRLLFLALCTTMLPARCELFFYGFRSPVIMASHMKLGWRPSLDSAEVRKKFFGASFGFFDARAGLAKS